MSDFGPTPCLALSAAALTPEELTLLTPRLMAWRPAAGARAPVWLMDLTDCRGYWAARAAARRETPLALIRLMLQRLLTETERPWRAALAQHPWQAALGLALMEERGLTGLVALDGPLGRAFFQQLTWSAWLSEAGEIGAHFADVKAPRFQAAGFAQKRRQLAASIQRLRLPLPAQLAAAPPLAMRRRFGATIALLWEWMGTGCAESPPAKSLLLGGAGSEAPGKKISVDHATGFPWRSWRPPTVPRISRHLEFPIWQWDPAAPLLTEDLDRLCRLPDWHPEEKVTELTWRLTRDDLSTFDVVLRFRHPHALHREAGHHRTALLQANFAFAAVLARQPEPQAFDFPAPVVAWELLVTGRLTMPKGLKDLFGEAEAGDGALAQLENELPLALQQFDLKGDWLPEDSYVPAPAGPPWAEGETAPPWIQLARARPLFLYEQPLPLTPGERSSLCAFLERTSGKWWHGKGGATRRDYYRRVDHALKAQWVFVDEQGRWYAHGLFC